MVGSGHADCQKASPRYSRSSQRLHWTAVNQKMMQSTAESPSLSREVETRQAGASLPTSARALSTTESREQTAIMTPETAKRKAVWLTETSGPTRQRSSQNAASRVGRSRILLSSSKMAQRAADARQMTVTRVAASTAVRRGAFTCSHRGARQRNAPG